MENDPNNFITIKCVGGQVQLPKSEVEQFPFISPIDKIKVAGNKKLIYLPPDHVDLTKIRPQLTAEMFSLLTNKNFELPADKSFEETFKLWKEADFLLISDNKQAEIADQILKKATTVGNFVDIQNSHLPRERDYYEYDEHSYKYLKILDIKPNPKLTSIAGIEKLSHLKPNDISIYGNSLTSVNLDHIFKHFPKLQHLYLADNKLSEIHATYLPSDISLTIKGNRLSKEQIEKLKSLQTLPWYKKLYNSFPSLFMLNENSSDLRIYATAAAMGVLAGLIGGKITDHYYGLSADEISGEEDIFFWKATLSICAYFLIDIMRSITPFKPAEIKGADEQKK